MPGRGLWIALVVAVVLGAGYWYSERLEKEKQAKPPDATPKLIEVADDQIQKVTIAKKDAPPVTLERQGTKWMLTAPTPAEVDAEAVASMVSTLAGFGTDKLIEEKASDLSSFGLGDGAFSVSVATKDGKSQRILIGDETPSSGGFYAKRDGDPRVFTIFSYNRAAVDKSWKDLRDKRLLRFEEDKVTRVELTAKSQTTAFAKNAGGDWQIIAPQSYRADNLGVQELVRKLREAKMDVSLPDDEAAKLPASFASGALVATAKVTSAPGTETIEIRKVKEDFLAKSSSADGAHKVTKELADALDKATADFRNKKLFDFGFADPERIEVRDGTLTVTLTRNGDAWMRAGKKLDGPGSQTLIDRLRELTSIRFMTSGFTEVQMELVVTSAQGRRVERVEIAKSGFSWIARRAGEPALYEIDGKLIEQIQQAMKDLKDAPSAKEEKKK